MMKTLKKTLLPVLALIVVGGTLMLAQSSQKALEYPESRRGEVVDEYHGVKVADPYRWLEDPNSDETHTWIGAQNALTTDYLSKIEARKTLRARLKELYGYERFGTPKKRGGIYFYTRNDGKQEQDALYYSTSRDEPGHVLLDPNRWSDDQSTTLADYYPSPDGSMVAYSISIGGSDWVDWHVVDVKSGKKLADTLRWSKFSPAAWSKDGKGFYYCRYPKPVDATKLSDATLFQQLYYHKIGEAQSEDLLIHEDPSDGELGFWPLVTEDGRYLVLSIWKGTHPESDYSYIDLKAESPKTVKLMSGLKHRYSFLGNFGTRWWFLTHRDADRGRIVSVDISKPEYTNWKKVVPEAENAIESAAFLGGRLIVHYLEHAKSKIDVFEPDGQREHSLNLPDMGSVWGLTGTQFDEEVFFHYSTFTTPSQLLRYDTHTKATSIFRTPKVKFDPTDYVTKQVFYKSSDGTSIPMFIAHRKDVKPDGSTPVLLNGYGGFAISFTPWFNRERALWMELGGVFARANIRGGGEYGKEWHESAIVLNRQKCFDDFIAAGEWLIENGYTDSKRLAITGGSNGGLLVGACLTQRPDLFGAAIPFVGVLDMLRFQKFTVGWAWVSEYGSPDDPTEFKNLYSYSPLHNLKRGTKYPSTFILTGDHDDRVVPAHSYKFAAAMQYAQAGDAPVLIRIDTKAGHGGGTSVSKAVEEGADWLSFLAHVFDMDVNGE